MKTKLDLDFGSVKNVGTSAVETIVQEREKNGEFKSFTDFAERMQGEAVNKKCIESLIKSGAFDELGETRHTLLNSFEGVLDIISGETKKSIEGQVTMFDIASEETTEKHKYTLNKAEEYDERKLLDMEKEMLGIYISGHPLEKYREQIAKQANINTLQIREFEQLSQAEIENPELLDNRENFKLLQDGQFVKFAGIITSIKKKYTKNNKIMAFATLEDLYGSIEVIIFENCYLQCSNELIDENIVLVEGRLSIREDENTKIVAREIKKFEDTKSKSLYINITNLTENQKDKLRGALKFFTGDKNNVPVVIINGERHDPAGGLYVTKDILEELQEIVGQENAKIE